MDGLCFGGVLPASSAGWEVGGELHARRGEAARALEAGLFYLQASCPSRRVEDNAPYLGCAHKRA